MIIHFDGEEKLEELEVENKKLRQALINVRDLLVTETIANIQCLIDEALDMDE